MTTILGSAEVSGGVDAGLLVLRVAIGIVMVAHGYNHIWGGGKIKGTAGWFESLGMKPGILHAWLASVTELEEAIDDYLLRHNATAKPYVWTKTADEILDKERRALDKLDTIKSGNQPSDSEH